VPSQPSGVEIRRRLTGDELGEVRSVIDAATKADGVRPLNEHVMLHLRHGGDEDTRNLLAREVDGSLVGYAHLDVTDAVAGPSAELVVHPMHRGRGHGRALVDAAQQVAVGDTAAAEQAPGRGTHPPANTALRLWSHGSHRSARELASRMGFTSVRSLWQMRRSLYAPIPDPVWPDGVTARTYEPGRDEQAWLDLNARAFAEHPEQGDWTQADLARRTSEAWFDPAGFFLAERAPTAPRADPRLVGFHWTKVHGGSPDHAHSDIGPHEHSPHGHDPIGEVYVLGVDPSERGTGVGHALTLLGMCHLRGLGLGQVMLYVDESNSAAIRLYESLGFIHWDTDVMYARRPDESAASASATPRSSVVPR
jgi:mycothiol synthase